MAKSFFPKSADFFQKFTKIATLAKEASDVFVELVKHPENAQTLAKKLADLETQADRVVQEGRDALHEAFTTPIERNDVHRLFVELDSVLDQTDAAGQRIALYELTRMPADMVRLAETSAACAAKTLEMILSLDQIKKPDPIRAHCKEVIELEKQSDQIFRSGLGKLFKEETDVKRIIMLKETYEFAESITDACESVAHTVESIVLDYA